MKKTILLGVLVIACIHAQGQIRFGVKGGMNVSSFDMSSAQGISLSFSNRIAFNAGALVEIPIGGFFAVQPELLLSSKGARFEISNTDMYTIDEPPYGSMDIEMTQKMKFTITPFYVELPVYLKAGFEAGPGKFILGIGPYIAYGVGGKLKADVKMTSPLVGTLASGEGKLPLFKTGKLEFKGSTIDGESFNMDDISDELTLKKAPLKRFDAGFAGFAGYELKLGIFLTVGYHAGLNNILNIDDVEGGKLRNKTFSVSVGYKF